MLNLLITADMNIVIDDKDVITVTADGGQIIVVTLPSIRTAFQIWRRHGSVLRPAVPAITSRLSLSTLTVNLVVDDTLVACIGANVPITLIGRMTNIPRLQVFYGRLIGLLLK
ncbi:MAG: hypothetical protein AAF846_12525 [Chloroflexota bacterium]